MHRAGICAGLGWALFFWNPMQGRAGFGGHLPACEEASHAARGTLLWVSAGLPPKADVDVGIPGLSLTLLCRCSPRASSWGPFRPAGLLLDCSFLPQSRCGQSKSVGSKSTGQ